MTQARRRGDEARIVQRFKRLGPQSKALGLALEPYTRADGRIDAARWDAAFVSADPKTITQVIAVVGAFGSLVNHLNEMLVAAGRLAGLEECRADAIPPMPAVVTAVQEDGGLTANQAENLIRLGHMRNRLQHNSPGVQADEVQADIELLQKTLRGFVKSYIAWLNGHGIELLPSA